MPSIDAILLLIYALSAYIVSANPVPDITPPPTQQYGQRAGVNISVFNDTSCQKRLEDLNTGLEWASEGNSSLHYGVMVSSPFFTIQTYSLSRFLASNERLDWSGPYPSNVKSPLPGIPETCGTFVQRTNPDVNGNPLHQDICYKLEPGATVCFFSQ